MTTKSRYQTSRGGGWDDEAVSSFLARCWEVPSNRHNLGFRCARTERARLFRVFRGGCWYSDDATSLAARARRRVAPSIRYGSLGFRCVREGQTRFAQTSQVLRGNSWCGDAANCHAAYRNNLDPDGACDVLGIRCARNG